MAAVVGESGNFRATLELDQVECIQGFPVITPGLVSFQIIRFEREQETQLILSHGSP